MTERFHAAAQKLSASIARGKGGIVHVQQLFLEAQWYKSEACMVESWHSLSVAIREAQEISRFSHIITPLLAVAGLIRMVLTQSPRHAPTR